MSPFLFLVFFLSFLTLYAMFPSFFFLHTFQSLPLSVLISMVLFSQRLYPAQLLDVQPRRSSALIIK